MPKSKTPRIGADTNTRYSTGTPEPRQRYLTKEFYARRAAPEDDFTISTKPKTSKSSKSSKSSKTPKY